jgi:NADH-quinone oxidoreductase subunit G
MEPEMNAEPTLTLDGRAVPVRDERNLLELVRSHGVELPTFCYHSELSVYGACRLCMVDVAGRGLVAACSTRPEPGMVVRTHTPAIRELRKVNLELLLASGDHDCPTCSKSGACKLQSLALRLGVDRVRFHAAREDKPLDFSTPGLVRDPNKCVLCGDCVRVCQEIQGLGVLDFAHRGARVTVVPAFDKPLADVACVQCGQCAAVCPTGALTVRMDLEPVHAALADPDLAVVAQVAPAVRVALGELFGLKDDSHLFGRMVAALRRLGFAKVFDTAFAADLTVLEEAHELVARKTGNGRLPLFTSCCPAWVRFAEQECADLLPNLSTCRSPQQMFGALAKEVLPAELGLEPGRLRVAAIMPCTAKKSEARRPELGRAGSPDVDFVLTTQELARMIQEAGLDLAALEPEGTDQPFGLRTGAGILFGRTGGVTEAVARHLTGTLGGPALESVRGTDGIRRATLDLPSGPVRCAQVHGLANARALVEAIRAGREDCDFVEVMACPGGCAGGGGQPACDGAVRRARAEGLRRLDAAMDLRLPADNPAVARAYQAALERPGSAAAHRLLHTRYHAHRRIQGDGIVLSEPGPASGRVRVSVCVGTACHLRGAQKLLQDLLAHVRQEGLADAVEVMATFCMEACDRGPTVRVDGRVLHRADLAGVLALVNLARKGELAPVEAVHGCR